MSLLDTMKKEFSKEIAAVIPASKYHWYKYNADRGANIKNTSGKRTLALKKGVMFGVRESSDGKSWRLISKELGPTIVFTLPYSKAEALMIKSSKSTGGIGKGIKTPAASKVSEEKRNTKAPVLAFTAGSILFMKQLGRYGEAISKGNTSPRMATQFQKAMDVKVKKGARVKATKDPVALKAAGDALKQAQSYLNKAYKRRDIDVDDASVNVYDAADVFKVAVAAYANNTKMVKNIFFDTNIREDMTNRLHKWYMAARP